MKAYLEPEDVAQMEYAASNLRDKILIRLLFRIGCRISEALALEVDNVDFTQGTVAILHLKRRVKIFCANCGATLGLSHSFCPRCGARISETT